MFETPPFTNQDRQQLGLVYPSNESIWTKYDTSKSCLLFRRVLPGYPLVMSIWEPNPDLNENVPFLLHLMWDTCVQAQFKTLCVTTDDVPQAHDLGLSTVKHMFIAILPRVWDIVVPTAHLEELKKSVRKSTRYNVYEEVVDEASKAIAYRSERDTAERGDALAIWLGVEYYRYLRNRLARDHQDGNHKSLEQFHNELKDSGRRKPLREVYLMLRQSSSSYVTGMTPSVPVRSINKIVIEGIRTVVYIPNVLLQGRCLIYVHGGGFVLGNEWSDYANHSRLCEGTNSVVVSIGYKLAPEDPFPAAVHSVKAVLDWFRSYGQDRYGIDPQRMAVMGVSAGGTVAAIVAFEDAISVPDHPLKFQVQWAPMVKLDATLEEESRQGDFLGLTGSRAWEYQDLSIPENSKYKDIFFNRHIRNLPPTIIYIPQECCFRMEATMYAQMLRRFRHEVEVRALPGIPHHGIDIAGISPANEVFDQVILDIADAFSRTENS